MSLSARWSTVLDELRAAGRYRSLRPPAGIDFTSNDYLGYARERRAESREPSVAGVQSTNAPQARDAYATQLVETGASSRLLRGDHLIWHEVESALAEWHSADAALMMTSGYGANEGLLSTVIEPGDWVATDEFVHASIIDGLRLCRPQRFRFRHNNLQHLEEGLVAARRQRPESSRQLFIITESLFSMDGDLAPLPELTDLAERFGVHLIVDEAHSTGCYGPSGSGCVDALGLRNRVLATIHTGGKALGVMGAYVCGSRLLKDYLVNRCRHLIYTTALPPIVGSWWLEMLERVKPDDEGRRRLHTNGARFREALAGRGIRPAGTEYIVPVLTGDDDRAVRVALKLQERGFDVRAIRPPSVPSGTSRLRISIHADQEPDTLDRLAAAVAEAMKS
jgi:8-amino-7-oxononanoate synthase